MEPLFIISFCLSLLALWFNWRCLKEITRREKQDKLDWENAIMAMKHKRGLIRDPKEYE